MPLPFPTLSEEFNATALKYLTTPNAVTIQMLLAKYSALNYKTDGDADKISLARSLFDCGLQALKKAGGAPSFGGTFTPGEISYPANAKNGAAAIFSRLAAHDSLGMLPAGAPEELADAALILLRKAENLDPRQFSMGDRENYRNSLTALAELALEYAEKYTIDREAPDVTTSQNIAASRRIVLKKEAADGPK